MECPPLLVICLKATQLIGLVVGNRADKMETFFWTDFFLALLVSLAKLLNHTHFITQ